MYFLGTITLFAGNYAPEGWAICNGAALSINDHAALYSLIGTTYGGDGRTSFNLPNLSVRVPVGVGSYAGNLTYVLGQADGAISKTLSLDNLPAHTHTSNVTASNITCTSSSDASFKMPATSTAGNVAQPDNNSYFAKAPANGGGINIYNNNNNNPAIDVQLPGGEVNFKYKTNTINTGDTGLGAPINNIQPSIVLNYIICTTDGMYPSFD